MKKWAGAALEIGSAAIPFGGAGRLGASAGRNLLQKTLGRKLSQEIGAGAASGLASGAIFGTGRGLIEDKNSLITGLQDAAGGLAAGGLIGGAGGYLEKAVRANMLENSKPISELTKTQIKNLVKQGKEYYWDYLQWRNLTSPQLGKINFPGTQAGEIRVHNMKMIPKIPEQIRSAQGLRYSNDKPWRHDANNFYKIYNTYKGKNYEYVIRNNANKTGNDFYQIKEVDSAPAYLHHNQALETEPVNIINDISENINPVKPDVLKNQGQNGNQRYYITKDTFNGTPQATSPGSKEDILKDTHKSRSHATSTDALGNPYNIINNNSENINPVPMIIPPQILQNLQNANQTSFLLEGSVEMNVDKNGNQIFTPHNIKKMPPDEFEENIPIIEQQLRDGLIRPKAHQVNYSGYINPETGDGKIFSREAISQMSSDEYTGNEPAIMAQLKSIGIPYESDLELASMHGGGLVYVRPYTRSDGTKVRGYYRSV